MANNVCPVWVGYLLSHPLRKMFQNPEDLLSPYVRPGMTVADVGCAMGFFTLPMARMVGADGRVICVDIQEGMLKSLKKRARKAGVEGVMDYRLCDENSFCLAKDNQGIDFILASAVGHEVPDVSRLFQEIFLALKPGGKLLFSEPAGHVSQGMFDREQAEAEACGFRLLSTPEVRRSHTVVLGKGQGHLGKKPLTLDKN